jgi:hypothetical protein
MYGVLTVRVLDLGWVFKETSLGVGGARLAKGM